MAIGNYDYNKRIWPRDGPEAPEADPVVLVQTPERHGHEPRERKFLLALLVVILRTVVGDGHRSLGLVFIISGPGRVLMTHFRGVLTHFRHNGLIFFLHICGEGVYPSSYQQLTHNSPLDFYMAQIKTIVKTCTICIQNILKIMKFHI